MSAPGHEVVQSLIGRIYDATIDETLWPRFLTELATAVRGEIPGMVFRMPEEAAFRDRVVLDCDPGFLRSHDEYYGRILLAVREYIPPDGLHDLDEVLPGGMERWEFYADWMRPQGMRHYIGQLVLRPDGIPASFGVYRAPRVGPFAAEDAALMRALAPHYARAVHLCDRFSVVRAERDVAMAALDRLSIALVLCDERGHLLAANSPAEDIAGERDGLRITPSGLLLDSPRAQRELARLVCEATRTARGDGVGPGGGAVAVPRPSCRHPYELLVTALPREGLAVGPHRAAVAIFLADPERRPRASEEVLQELYGLTPAEARVAASLARGDRLEDAADALGVAIGTARNQLKQVFDKTDSHRQADLVRRILSGPSRL